MFRESRKANEGRRKIKKIKERKKINKGKGGRKKISVYSETKSKNYLYRSLRVRFQKHNIVVRFASGNESKKTM